MEFITNVIAWCSSPVGAAVFIALFAVSEALAMIPSVAANSVFQAVKNAIVWLKNKFSPKA
jgi:hypothetical protein